MSKILIFLFFIFGSSLASAGDGVVAIVNNDVVTQKDLNDSVNFMRMQMSAQYSEQEVEDRIKEMLPGLISRLIEDRLILQAAYKENIIVDPHRIKARVEEMKKGYSTEADFKNALVTQGLTLADIELKIKEQLLMWEIIGQKIKSKIVVTPQEVTDYYYAHQQDFKKSEQRLTRFLIIEDPDLAKKIEKRINRYKDLDTLAKAYSLEVSDLGWMTREQLNEEIADIVFDLQVGRLLSFLNSNKNFYIFEVKATKPPMEKPLFDAQEEINDFLFRAKMQKELFEWLTKLRSEAYIEIKDKYGAG